MARLVWHRRDLRLRDNELYRAGTVGQQIFSVFVFDPSEYAPRPTGIPDGAGGQLKGVTHGPHFTRRLLDAVHSLRRRLRSTGGDLIVRRGRPSEALPPLARELQVEEVAWSEIPGHYERAQSEQLKKALRHDRCRVHTTCSLTLVHPRYLPTDPCTWARLARPKEKQRKAKSKPSSGLGAARATIELASTIVDVSPSRFAGMPTTIMGDFRRVARTIAPIRELVETPQPGTIAQHASGMDSGAIPSLEELSKPLLDPALTLLGCLPADLIRRLVRCASEMPRRRNIDVEECDGQHLENFVQNHAASAERGLCDTLSDNDSSKLSTPLALGTLSPQQVYHCAKQQQNILQAQEKCNLGTASAADLNWLISHMEMRDFFIFDSFCKGPSAYCLHPAKPAHRPAVPKEWLPLSEHEDKFIQWAEGNTNLPLVDAGMTELITTGYTSNRVRQNIASLLTKDLKLDWRLGAEFFQLCLEDHCVAANFGNWIYFSGVGGDPKSRHFRTCSQAARYDPGGKYVRKWVERLRDGSANDVEQALRPWDYLKDWPAPIVPPETQLTWQDRERLQTTGRISQGDSVKPMDSKKELASEKYG